MMGRKSTGKRLRFEVFKRDHFTCQYCGAQPPDVVLVVDHIDPVALGGVSEIHNLIASCEACNQGKAHKPLGDRAIRPDADLLYLETQQEIAELRRYQEALAERQQVTTELVGALQDVWQDCSGFDWAPAETLVRELLHKHGPEVTEAALIDVANKMRGGYVSAYGSRWIGYLHTVANSKSKEMGEQ